MAMARGPQVLALFRAMALIPEDVHAPPEVGPSRRSLARSLAPSLTLLALCLVCAPSHLTLLTLLTLSHSVSSRLR